MSTNQRSSICAFAATVCALSCSTSSTGSSGSGTTGAVSTGVDAGGDSSTVEAEAGSGPSLTPGQQDAGGPSIGWLSVVGGQGLFAQTFDGELWSAATVSSVTLQSISCVGTTVGWAAGTGGWIGHTADSGSSWIAESAQTTADLHAIRFASTMYGVVAGDAGALEVTTDGGRTWSPGASGTGVSLRGVALGYDLAVVVGDEATVIRSLDGGRTWQPSVLAGASDLRSVAMDDTGGLILATDARGAIWASHDRGETFDVELAGSGDELSSVSVARDATIAFAVGTAGRAVVRASSGTWQTVATGVTVDLHAALVAENGTHLLTAGDDGVLLDSPDRAVHWERRHLATAADLYGLDQAW